MSGVLRLGNTGAGTGRSTVEASASNDQTFLLPEAGGTLLTSNTSIPGGTITLDGATLNITNGDLNVDSGTLFVDESTNRVGIGTTAPSHKLTLISSVDADLFFIQSTATANNTSLRFGISSNDSIIHASGGSSGNLAFNIYGNECMRINNACSLLLGLSSPLTGANSQFSKFVVQGNSGGPAFDGRIALSRGTAASALGDGNDVGTIYFTDIISNEFASITAAVDGTTGATDAPGKLEFATTADGQTTPTTNLTLTANGNLGFGINTPTSQSGRCLHINGLTGGQARIHLTTSASGSGVSEGSYIVALGAESGALAGSLGFENRENRDIFFSVGTSLTERFRIRQGTNAGQRLFAGIQTSGAFKVSNAQYVTRSASNGVGSGIFNSAFGDYQVTGFIHAIKTGTTDFCIVACYKSSTSTGVSSTVLANSGGLAPQASNSGGTVTFNDTSSDVKMISIIYLTEWSD